MIPNRREKRAGKGLMGRILPFALCLVLLLAAFCPAGAAAEEETRTASLKVHLAYNDNGKETPIPGGKFEIYQVYAFDEAMNYVLCSDFSKVKAPAFDELKTAADQADAVKKFVSAANKAKPFATAETDRNGDAVFQIDEAHFGVYLVIETGRSGEAKKYNTATTVLVQVPEITEAGFGFETTLLPKVTPVGNQGIPKTGDENDLGLWAACAFLSGAALCLALIGLRRRRVR